MRLTVAALDADDRYRDQIRLHKRYRGPIRVGQICMLSTSHGKKALVQVRSAPAASEEETVYMDQLTRQKLSLVVGSVDDMTLKPVGVIRQFIWAAQATDPALAVAAKLGLASFALGLLSVALALIPLFLSAK